MIHGEDFSEFDIVKTVDVIIEKHGDLVLSTFGFVRFRISVSFAERVSSTTHRKF